MKLQGQTIGTTKHGYRVFALDPGQSSPMVDHRGGDMAVDDENKVIYAWGVFVALYGVDSVMKACNQYSEVTA